MKENLEKLLDLKNVNKSLEIIKGKTSPITILGLSVMSKICIENLITDKLNRKNVIITYNELQAQKLYQSIKLFDKDVIYIPKKDIVTYEYDAENMDILYTRQSALISLYNNEAKSVILSIETLMQPIISKKVMRKNILKLIVANTYDIEKIKEDLIRFGYERQDLVEGKGTFSIRGDILDIGLSKKQGVRIEFFGDEVDQIRYFEIESQRSNEVINQIKIYPLSEEIEEKPKGTFIEYFDKDTVILFDEIGKINIRAKNILNDNKYIIEDLLEKEKKIPYILENMYDMAYLENCLQDFQKVYLEEQDIITNRNNIITFPHEEVKEIEDTLEKFNKQEKENKSYRPKRRSTKEFSQGERVVFSDLKIGDYVVHKTSRNRHIFGSKYYKNYRWSNERLYKNSI